MANTTMAHDFFLRYQYEIKHATALFPEIKFDTTLYDRAVDYFDHGRYKIACTNMSKYYAYVREAINS